MARIHGLTAFVVVLLASFFLPQRAVASSCGASYETSDEALSACNAVLNNGTWSGGYSCRQGVNNYNISDGYHQGPIFSYCSASPPPCTDLPLKTFQGGLSSVCVSGCNYAPAPDLGGTSHQRINMDGSISEVFGGTYKATGAECSGGPKANPPVTDPTPERKLCGGGSCHDVAAGQFCAVNGAGVQVCVSDKPPPSGACITGGDTTLCAGNPPPLPPNPPIIDPVSQIAGQDRYADTSGGVTVNNTVNNYNTTGQPPQSGAGPNDSKDPASSSSSNGPHDDGTRASGGRDCGSPPMCEGSAATCMVVTQTYLLRCPPGGQGAGEGDGDTTVPGLEDVGEGPGPDFMREETLLDKLDQGGLGGGGQCPTFLVLDLDRWGVHTDGTSVEWCDLLRKAGYVLMVLAAFISMRILSEK